MTRSSAITAPIRERNAPPAPQADPSPAAPPFSPIRRFVLEPRPGSFFMISWPNFVSQLFNGLALGALLALISSGLTIIYGTLGVLNLAHGALFMLGGYAGFLAYDATGSFVLAIAAGALFVLVVGVII